MAISIQHIRAALRRIPVRQIACTAPIVLVGYWVVLHWPLIASGGRQLLDADRAWLVAAMAATGLGWVAVSLMRQGVVLERLPAGRLLATQFAAGAANHLLPAGIGASAVNLRFMRACGLPPARSAAAIALYFLAECVGRGALLVLLIAVFPHALRLHGLLPNGLSFPVGTTAAVVAGVCAAAVIALLAVRKVRTAVRSFLATALTDARTLHARPSRALALWAGALAFPALQAAGLVAVSMALAMPVPIGHVAVAYVAASIAAAALPTPGGLGSVDAALVFALVASGASVAAATSVVLGFRIVTVWIPLIPGALTLGALVRWKVV
ncbi:YbhN family protein [Streptomyces sp. NPDC088354]|uniref:lysylphosphatidylglycerol synthase transmembrane domain-containing protein n=1 Tax=unclassified Streptomyces TaxID=2593676 RepID=UPI0029AF0BFB|nr:lysylphosphatidylglycerol synthase domain-containing protein [Streptomyces sp. MI02-7b]MDX3076777.1 lysylphosphatidylglycerol synthase domain-containing protein [Streptomyces sp. MI02-7b]